MRSQAISFFLLSCCLWSWLPGILATATSKLRGNETDRLALLEFKAKITGDPQKVMRSWNESVHFCDWQGVTCGQLHQRVTKLDLRSLHLVGSLSPHIGNLSFLRILWLDNNYFNHEIPQQVSRLFRLQSLVLANNSFSGEIPVNISHCSNLVRLRLEGNKLVGNAPAELGSLQKLYCLTLNSNNLTGEIPSSFGNISSLESLYLAVNNFEGNIPDSLSKLRSLKYISLGSNKLLGTIPSSIYNLSSIVSFFVPGNQIQGPLPSEIGFTFPNLEFFNVADNQLSGPIPGSISNASNLIDLSLSINFFTGNVPAFANFQQLQRLLLHGNSLGKGEDGDLSFLSSLTNCTSLEMLSFARNNFGGVLPESISNLTKLVRMAVNRNRIHGSIPYGIGTLINLEALGMQENQLTGLVPSDIGRLQKLQVLFLNGNKLTGTIPSSLGNLTFLNLLSLGYNNLQGSITSTLGKCQNLQGMALNDNNLSGNIPWQVVSLYSLSIVLQLSRNKLSGSLPKELGSLTNLGALDVSENRLSGEVPYSLGSCIRLEFLYMEGNQFQGTIPTSLSSLKGMAYLDFARNNFSGQIPKYLEGFTSLQYLNLSFNNFEGQVPTKRVFKNLSAISLIGNSRLCDGIPDLKLPSCEFNVSKKRRLSRLKLTVSIFCGVLGLILLMLFLIYFGLRKRRGKLSSRSSSGDSFLRLSYQSLHKATDGFSSSNLIGAGSFGSVYKGILDHDGTIVAVKVLNLRRRGADKSFLAECEALRNIRHRNLMKILTACSGVDFQGNDFKALVYEFMVNGSLEEWLHLVHSVSEQHEESRKLFLLQRLNIAIDVACALEYLHHRCQTPIVHCDLKPSNVLLDSDMTASVGDFGLARFIPEASHQFSTNQTSSLGIKGTVGYAAPEYGMGSEVSTNGDVYSYGILLLEMFTGKRPADDMFKDGLNLHNYTKMALPERVAEIADPVILQGGEVETSTNEIHNQGPMRSNKIQEWLVSIFSIGIACSAELPRERMDISDVAAELHSIRNKLLEMGTRAGA